MTRIKKPKQSRKNNLFFEGSGILICGAFVLFSLSSMLIMSAVEQLDKAPTPALEIARDRISAAGAASRLSMRHRRPGRQDTISMADAGQIRTIDYQALVRPGSQRAKFEASNPLPSISVIQSKVEELRVVKQTIETHAEDLDYDIHDCPSQPPEGYPRHWSSHEVLSNWNPDDSEVPSKIYQGLCVFDWTNPEQKQAAENYRKAEMPFVLRNHDEVLKTAYRWSDVSYMKELIGPEPTRNEFAHGNHMMYWKDKGGRAKKPEGWKQPTENVEITFSDWYQKAMVVENSSDPVHEDHWYFRLNGVFEKMNDYLYDELPIFRFERPSFFMVNPNDARGINCRLGMKGTIAETHYDYSRNFILILGGAKRYILAPPSECQNLELYPQDHPSGRHSRLDWSNPSDWEEGRFPQAKLNEVVLQSADTLYLPTSWFHFIVSLGVNYQCNARSGITHENDHHIHECGFCTAPCQLSDPVFAHQE
jgi:hypothetical protein